MTLVDLSQGIDFVLPAELEAPGPAEARGHRRDGVRLLVSRRGSGDHEHHAFPDLPDLLMPGDLLVVNNSATLPAAVPVTDPGGLVVHFSTPRPDGSWLVELRAAPGAAVEGSARGGTLPYAGGRPGQRLALPGGARLRLAGRETARLWRARLSTAVVPYLRRAGHPIRYGYAAGPWPLESYQTVFATHPGSAEMPSAGRPFTAETVTRLVSRGVQVAPITLHTGVASPEADEPPYPEPYDVPPATARLVNLTRGAGGRVVAVGTTVVRALETVADRTGRVRPGAGWTGHVVTPEAGVAVVGGLLTGFHEPASSHLMMLAAIAGTALLRDSYAAALAAGYLWHEFGDVHLILR